MFKASMRWDAAEEATRMALEGVAAAADPAAGTEAGEMPLRLIDRAKVVSVPLAKGVAALSEGAGDAKARPTIQMARWPADAFRSNLRGTP